MKVVLRCFLFALVSLPCARALREHRSGLPTSQKQTATCGTALQHMTPEQQCNAALVFVLDLQKRMGSVSGVQNETETKTQASNETAKQPASAASNETVKQPANGSSNKAPKKPANASSNGTDSKCAEYLENLKAVNEAKEQCKSHSLTCWNSLKKHLGVAERILDKTKEKYNC
eukprot:CAMPEP_0179105554 /NCGR_PEP_ID=MMETSP0796-20121207/49029_1 /TAXON_ID=73915 /ORGANISM="Pyrodinium bahamense, Strain pbaha01" /LENGTH=173 /DNA_ID=CAMNT_0020803547 /DNA_START=39 /DNA_END=560 /DNA_ORIENTATION=-